MPIKVVKQTLQQVVRVMEQCIIIVSVQIINQSSYNYLQQQFTIYLMSVRFIYFKILVVFKNYPSSYSIQVLVHLQIKMLILMQILYKYISEKNKNYYTTKFYTCLNTANIRTS